jgi:hypothetical protein
MQLASTGDTVHVSAIPTEALLTRRVSIAATLRRNVQALCPRHHLATASVTLIPRVTLHVSSVGTLPANVVSVRPPTRQDTQPASNADSPRVSAIQMAAQLTLLASSEAFLQASAIPPFPNNQHWIGVARQTNPDTRHVSIAVTHRANVNWALLLTHQATRLVSTEDTHLRSATPTAAQPMQHASSEVGPPASVRVQFHRHRRVPMTESRAPTIRDTSHV